MPHQFTDSELAAFGKLFAGRDDVFAYGRPDSDRPGKFKFFTEKAALTPEVLRLHTLGERCVGVYPVCGDDKVSWWAVDFDAPKASTGLPIADPFPVVLAEAKAQVAAFERAGLTAYIERSRSGKGAHVWGFFAEPVPAATVSRVIRPLLLPAVTLDRVYPMQSALAPGKVGNLIALPYYGAAVAEGNSVFLDAALGVPIPWQEFHAELTLNYPPVLAELAKHAPPLLTTANPLGAPASLTLRPKRLISAGWLKAQSENGCRFLREAWVSRRSLPEPHWYAALGQATCFANGREIAHAISRDYPGYLAKDTNDKYDQALGQPPVGCAWVHTMFPQHACASCPMTAPYHMANKSLLDLTKEGSAPMEHGGFAAQVEKIERRQRGEEPSGIKWQIPGLDRITTLRPAELTVIGAMPSMGKTALLVDAAYRIANAGTPVLVFSAETAKDSLRFRILARVSGVDSMALRGERTTPNGDIAPLDAQELAKVTAAAEALERLPLYENYTDITADQILANIERVLLANAIGFDDPYVVIFDYLQYGARTADDDSNYTHISRLSSEFKATAKITNHPIVVLSQLQRKAEEFNEGKVKKDGGEERPNMTWFKESGRIEQDMDVGMILTGTRVAGAKSPRTIWLVKQREAEANVQARFVLRQDISRFDETATSHAMVERTDGLENLRPRVGLGEE